MGNGVVSVRLFCGKMRHVRRDNHQLVCGLPGVQFVTSHW